MKQPKADPYGYYDDEDLNNMEEITFDEEPPLEKSVKKKPSARSKDTGPPIGQLMSALANSIQQPKKKSNLDWLKQKTTKPST